MPEKTNHSPRISFSHDFLHSDSIPIEQSPLQSPSDFDFSIPGDVVSGENVLSAEEFFHDGKILPTEIKKRTEPETNPIRDVKPVHEIEEVEVMETKPRLLSFLSSSEPGRTKEELNPIRYDKPAQEIELEDKPDTGSFLWFNGNSPENCEIGIGLTLLTNSKQKKSKKLLQVWSFSSSSHSSSEKKKKKSYGGEISVDSVLDVFPSWSMFGLGLIYIGTGGNKNRSMLFDW